MENPAHLLLDGVDLLVQRKQELILVRVFAEIRLQKLKNLSWIDVNLLAQWLQQEIDHFLRHLATSLELTSLTARNKELGPLHHPLAPLQLVALLELLDVMVEIQLIHRLGHLIVHQSMFEFVLDLCPMLAQRPVVPAVDHLSQKLSHVFVALEDALLDLLFFRHVDLFHVRFILFILEAFLKLVSHIICGIQSLLSTLILSLLTS